MSNSIINRKMRRFSIINRKMRHFSIINRKTFAYLSKKTSFSIINRNLQQPIFILDLAAAITETSLKTKNSLGMDDSLKQKY